MAPRRLLPAAFAAAILMAASASAQHGGTDFIAAFDTDHDGRLTRAEYDAARDARFRTSDTDGDGSVSETEYVAEFSPRLEHLVAQEDNDEKKQEQRQRQLRQTHVRFGVIDTNKDARIDRPEYLAVAARAFAEQDADRDGVVTSADVAATTTRQASR